MFKSVLSVSIPSLSALLAPPRQYVLLFYTDINSAVFNVLKNPIFSGTVFR
nr:MAG TPA: hypothetical protein [Bacteriophage sp.]